MISSVLPIENLSYWERKFFFDNIDYLIIGAGIVGYSTALKLRELNPDAKIVIIERGYLPSGASSKNAGFACFGSATELYDDLQKFDEETVWKTVEMRWNGLQKLRSIIGDKNLEIQFNGSWDLITSKEIERFEETLTLLPEFNKRLQAISGHNEVYSVDNNLSSKFGLNGIQTSFYNKLEGQIDTSSLNSIFHQLVQGEDIRTLFGIQAISIEDGQVTTNIGKVEAKKILVCTNGFAAELIKDEDVKPARAQVLITKPINNLKVEGTFHYDCGYYYFRNIDNRILFGGGRNLDFDGETTTSLETTELIRNRLSSILKEIILPDTPHEIDYYWAGVMGVGDSKKPIIKKINDHSYCAIRLGGMGVAIGTLVGEELALLASE